MLIEGSDYLTEQVRCFVETGEKESIVHAGRTTAELIRRKIGSINDILQNPDDGLPAISISCGVAYGADYGDEKTLFNAADAALYHVKYAGGCGCEVSK